MWTLFNGRADDTDTSELTDFEKQKCPKPDYVFYLPMYNLSDGPKIPKITNPEARQWHQAPNTSLMEPFSWSNLKELFAHGLRPSPFRVFNDPKHDPPKEASLKSYPWLIVEHKKEAESRSVETVCCQAANASACAVKLSRIAARYAVELADNAQVPPVPTITTIGSHVKVWIMYFAKDFQGPWVYHSYPKTLKWKWCKEGYVSHPI